MTAIPASHIADAHKLEADGEVFLYELVPAIGSGTLRFKGDNDVTWRGNVYTGLPVTFSGEEISAESGFSSPKLTIGQPTLDLSIFKPLVFDGTLDGGTVTRIKMLLSDVTNNTLIRQVLVYEIRQVLAYSRNLITLQLALPSDGVNFVMPNRQYIQPDFPTVLIT